MKHTPGPWRVGDNSGHNANTIIQRREDGSEALAIANVYNVPMHMTVKEVEKLTRPAYIEGLANARLMASAPELLDALRPFAEFAAKFNAQPIRGLADELYSIHSGDEGASFRLSDAQRALALLKRIEEGGV